jgi:hypothetical protein
VCPALFLAAHPRVPVGSSFFQALVPPCSRDWQFSVRNGPIITQ